MNHNIASWGMIDLPCSATKNYYDISAWSLLFIMVYNCTRCDFPVLQITAYDLLIAINTLRLSIIIGVTLLIHPIKLLE